MSSCWILTASGRRVDLLDPRPDMFCLEDIVHSLVKTCRFVGQCSRFYSVAEHCWIGSYQFSDRALQVEFQLHDATEAYLGDMSGPLKNWTFEYKLIEDKMDCVIRERFRLPPKMSPEVKAMDLRMLATERRDLLPPGGGDEWESLWVVEPLEQRISFLHPPDSSHLEYDLLQSFRKWFEGGF